MNRLFLLLCLLVLISCHVKTPEEAAKESFDKMMKKMEQDEKRIRDKADSLYYIAAGYNYYVSSKVRRMMALDELKKEFPELDIDWEGLRTAIINDEIFKEKP